MCWCAWYDGNSLAFVYAMDRTLPATSIHIGFSSLCQPRSQTTMSFEEYLQEELTTLEEDTLYEVGDINCEWELEYTTQE